MELFVLYAPHIYLVMSCVVMVWAGLLSLRFVQIIRNNIRDESTLRVDDVLDWLFVTAICLAQAIFVFGLSPWVMMAMDALGTFNWLAFAYVAYVTYTHRDSLSEEDHNQDHDLPISH